MTRRAAVRSSLAALLWLCAGCDGCGAREARSPAPQSPKAPDEANQGTDQRPADDGGTIDPEVPEMIAIDTHVDTPQRMLDDGDDIAERLAGGHLDLPRMREGGLTGAFFSIWVNPRRYRGDEAYERALALIGAVRSVAEEHPDRAAVCTSAREVRRAAHEGKAALLMGVEGGHALGTGEPELALERLRELYERGARYLTITWSTDNPLGHSSTGAAPSKGLTELGRWVVSEMNELGMIDVSHVSDATFEDIMDETDKPVLASHSSARALSDHPRNMTDAMIRRVAEGGGAVCINYFSQYIDVAYRDRRRALEREHAERFEALSEEHSRWIARGEAAAELAALDPDLDAPTLGTLAEHFAHVAEVAGPEAVCLGSDFDGVPELPLGMRDVSDLPALREDEARDLPIEPIYGGNVLRVLEAQESAASEG